MEKKSFSPSVVHNYVCLDSEGTLILGGTDRCV
jgi:hypothetical protein